MNTSEPVIPFGTSIGAGGLVALRTNTESSTGAARFSLGDQDEARLHSPVPRSGPAPPADEFDQSHIPVNSRVRDFDDARYPSEATREARSALTLNADNNTNPLRHRQDHLHRHRHRSVLLPVSP